MAFSYRLSLLRTLLECLGKPDERREERDQSGQEPHEINQIGHGHHLPSDGGRCPAHGTAVNDIDSTRAQLYIRIYVRMPRVQGLAPKGLSLCHIYSITVREFCLRMVASMCLGTAWVVQLPIVALAAALAASLPFLVA